MNNSYIDFESLRKYFQDKEWMIERLDNLEYDLSKISKMNVYSAVNYIRKAMGYDEYLEDYASADTRAAADNIIEREIASIPSQKVRELTIKRINEIKSGLRDFRF